MTPFIVWIRTQLIFWLFIPVAISIQLKVDDLWLLFCVGTAIVGFVFGLPGILGNYLYIGLLRSANIPRQHMLTYLLIGLPFIMLCCVTFLFFCMSSLSLDIWDMFVGFSGLVIAVVIATVLSTISCYRLLLNYIYPATDAKTV